MKIFVSSTYTDLVDYRKAAERAINLLDQQFKGMEYFGARPEEPKTACLKEIEQADVFVGIYAHRYGFIPEGDSKSITEQEFDHAQKLGKPIFCYRVNADFPWSPKFIERGDAEKKLAAFIAHIEKDFVRNEFTTPDDLLAKISADLSRYLATHGAVALITHPLPPVPYYVHTYPLQANFTGRKSEREELNDWMGRDARSVFVLEAIGGMGKSALAWVWTQEIFSLGIPVAGVFWWSFYEERDLGRFLEKAIEYASGGKIDPKQIPSDRDRVDALANLLRQSRFLFVLDGFERVLRAYARMDAAYRGDEVDEDEHNYRACTDPNLGIFLRCLASGGMLTKTLITSRLFPRELDELESVRHLPLTGIDADDAVEFFHKQGIKGTHTEIASACAAYGFHPLTLRLLAGALKQDPRYHADINNAPNVEMGDADKEKRMQRMLEFAYNSLPPQEQKLLSQLSAFRSPLKYETIQEIFTAENAESAEKKDNEKISASSASSAVNFVFPSKRELAHAISNLAERGLYMRDAATDTFDLHPVIRRYCYDRLADKPQTHAILIVYFAKIETPQKIQTLADLQATIELYHHTVRAGRYDEAWTLFRDRLHNSLYYQLGAYQTYAELLRALFPDGDPSTGSGQVLPRLKDESAQAWTLAALANSYSLAGQPRRAVPLFLQHNAIYEKAGNKKNLAIGLGNVAHMAQIQLGEVKAAEQNLRRRIEICREIKDELREAVGHQELGRVLAYRGQFAKAERELDVAFEMFGKENNVQSQSVVSAYRALRALLMGDASAALASARQARAFAEEDARTVSPVERDFIRAEWLIGAALVALASGRGEAFAQGTFGNETPGSDKNTLSNNYALANASPLQQAEQHLAKALSRDRKIGMVESEAPILLEFAKLRFAQARQQTADNRQQKLDESFAFAREALEIAERCEYRLQEAEIQNFLAEWWKQKSVFSIQNSDKTVYAEAIAKAKQHAERAKERAWCDGPPYHYKVAYEQAEKMLEKLDKEIR
jgi:hypothetical protein